MPPASIPKAREIGKLSRQFASHKLEARHVDQYRARHRQYAPVHPCRTLLSQPFVACNVGSRPEACCCRLLPLAEIRRANRPSSPAQAVRMSMAIAKERSRSSLRCATLCT